MKYKLQDLIDIQQFQELQDRLNVIYSFTSAILDLDGNILTATGWQDICTKFHRVNEQCKLDCQLSDKYILGHMDEANPAVSYECRRGLIDVATPIIIDGVHYGNFFTGQFFLKKPDLEFYRQQAQKFGFDEAAYIAAVKKVPVWSKKQLNNYLYFIKGLIEIISESGLKNLREIETRSQIIASESQYKNLANDLPLFVSTFLPDGTITYTDKMLADLIHQNPAELIGKNFFDFLTPEDLTKLKFKFSQLSPEKPIEAHDQKFVAQNGEVKWHHWINRAIFDKNGKPQQFQAVGQDITERMILEQEKDQQNLELSIVFEAGKQLSQSLDLQEIYKTFYFQIKRIMKCENLYISEFNPETEMNKALFAVNEGKFLDVSEFPQIPLEPEGRGIQSPVIRSGIAQNIRDYPAALKNTNTNYFINEEGKPVPDEIIEEDTPFTKSALVIPILLNNRVEGVVQIQCSDYNAYTQSDLRLAELLVSQIAVAANNAKLYQMSKQEISERKAAEEALLKSESKFRQIFETTTVGISLHDSNGKFVDANPAILNLLGYSREEYLNLSLKDISYYEDYQNDHDDVRKLWDGVIDSFQMEKRNLHKDGHVIWGNLTCTIVRDHLGNPLYSIGLFQDITSRKESEKKERENQAALQKLLAEAERSRLGLLSLLEDQKVAEEKIRQLNTELEKRVEERTAQLVAANKELEAFSYSVSHDLRAPLRGIDGWSLALKEDYEDKLDEKGNLYINRVRSEIQRMGELIDGLLMLSRVTRMETKKSMINLSEIAHTVANRLFEEFPGNSTQITIQPEMMESGDYNLLSIVLTNLLNNAFKFSSKVAAPKIEFGRVLIDGKPTFFIKDNGAGFDMTYSKNLFGAFQRMHRQTDFPGTGVGLATVQRIINRHNGRVWAEAKVNEGATFFFTLWEEK